MIEQIQATRVPLRRFILFNLIFVTVAVFVVLGFFSISNMAYNCPQNPLKSETVHEPLGTEFGKHVTDDIRNIRSEYQNIYSDVLDRNVGMVMSSVCFSGWNLYWFGDTPPVLPMAFSTHILGSPPLIEVPNPDEWLFQRALNQSLYWINGTTAVVDPASPWLNTFHYLEAIGFLYSVARLSNLEDIIRHVWVLSNLHEHHQAIYWSEDLTKLIFDNVVTFMGTEEPTIHNALYGNAAVCFDRLLVTFRHPDTLFITQEDASLFRAHIYNRLHITPRCMPNNPSVLFINRNKGRKVLNEGEIVSWMKERGLIVDTLVPISTTPISAQIAMFASADIVIGVTGAGLANIVFTPPGRYLIVLSFPGLHEHDSMVEQALNNRPRPFGDTVEMWENPYPILANFMEIGATTVSIPFTSEELRRTTTVTEDFLESYGNFTYKKCTKIRPCLDGIVTYADFTIDLDLVKSAIETAIEYGFAKCSEFGGTY